ncbi:MAG TPA: hypothetical protein VGZ29_12830 [Terriglobia bacterium]|nr:hypothetical protein [Terriglobia bacterium]
MRVFHGFFPREVTGMVLVDPMNEDMTIHIHNHIEGLRPSVVFIFHLLGIFGWWRLTAPQPDPVPKAFTADEWRTVWGLEFKPKAIEAQPKEPPRWVNGEMARASGGLGDLPLIVLSAGRPGRAEDVKLEDQTVKLRLHDALARQSTCGRRAIVDSGHEIACERPETVADAIREVVAEARLATCEP